MSFRTEIYPYPSYATEAAGVIGRHLPAQGSVVLTGGTTAAKVYPVLARGGHDWFRLDVTFSDERCVPPEHEESNYKMACGLLLEVAAPAAIHRMPGELDPEEGAAHFHRTIAPAASKGFDLLLIGMGADAHVGAMFPHSPALGEQDLYCRAVDRPDGMRGLTLTPPAMLGAKKILVLVTGEAKAETVKRVIQGGETPDTCPARLLVPHPDVTFLLDRAAASAL